jgi:hypothetical protein
MYERKTVDFMIGVCYSSKTEQSITSLNGTYKLLPLHNPGNNLCYKEIKIQIYAVVFWVIRSYCNLIGHTNIS